MNHSGAESDQRVAVDVTKDKNGIDQVVLQNPRGASAMVWIPFSLSPLFIGCL